MLQQKGYKYRIYPKKKQQNIINQTLGCSRFVYNRFLAVRKESWSDTRTSVTYKQTSSMLTELKRDPAYVWLLGNILFHYVWKKKWCYFLILVKK